MQKKAYGIIKAITIFTIILLSIFALQIILAYGNVNELEIIAPKEAGTGNPALNENARYFRAYPGIEYKIKAAVIGGKYPYIYSLSNAPESMTIDRKSGTIIWANPQASAQNIGLTVTDANGNSVQSSWSINVTSDSFIFVDACARRGDGTISNPFNSIEDFLALDSSYVSDIVYFGMGYMICRFGEAQLHPEHQAAVLTEMEEMPISGWDIPMKMSRLTSEEINSLRQI